MRHFRLILYLLFAVGAVFAQPAERPPRPGEPIRPPQRDDRPAVDRRTRREPKEFRFSAATGGGTLILPEGTWISLSAGATYGNLGFGAEAGYCDYRREFVANASSFVSPGDDDVSEHGSFVRPAVYAEYKLDFGAVVVVPRTTLGYVDIVTRRWSIEDPDSTRFLRTRLTNTWEINAGVPVGPVILGATVQWWVINPWFYFYPEDMGVLSAGAWIKLR
ncbi:MAG TPA: hypothetical protein ENN75_01905 [candidate division Zixibacteria bacterium]|nr:hypothetical protein [candidate division Zixibacteria bacterium]